MMQGVFSLMHECYHDLGHSNKKVNSIMALLSSTIFGTSSTLFKVNHIGHHYRNRTRHEIFEFTYPNESKIINIKVVFYGSCGVWILGFLGLIILPLHSHFKIFGLNDGNNTYSESFKKFSKKRLAQNEGRTYFFNFIPWWIYLFYELGLENATNMLWCFCVYLEFITICVSHENPFRCY